LRPADIHKRIAIRVRLRPHQPITSFCIFAMGARTPSQACETSGILFYSILFYSILFYSTIPRPADRAAVPAAPAAAISNFLVRYSQDQIKRVSTFNITILNITHNGW
jgi:hypothetical protein